MRFVAVIVALLCATPAWAGDVVVSGAWARATAPGQTDAAVQFSIVSQQDVWLLNISSPVAESVELHTMKQESGMMKMRRIPSLPLPAGRQIDLGVAGTHVMLIKLKHPLKEGDSIPLAITVQHTDSQRETVNVQAEIRPLTTASDKHEHHH
jgi:periplasmic copper chaperone A